MEQTEIEKRVRRALDEFADNADIFFNIKDIEESVKSDKPENLIDVETLRSAASFMWGALLLGKMIAAYLLAKDENQIETMSKKFREKAEENSEELRSLRETSKSIFDALSSLKAAS